MASCCYSFVTSQFSQWSYWVNVTVATAFNTADIVIAPPETGGSFSFTSPIAVIGSNKSPASCRPTTFLGNGSDWICDVKTPGQVISFLIDSSNAYPPNSVPMIQSVNSYSAGNDTNSGASDSVVCTQAEQNAKCPVVKAPDPTTALTGNSSNQGLSPSTITTISIFVGAGVAALLIVGLMRWRNTAIFKSWINRPSSPPLPLESPHDSIPQIITISHRSSVPSSGGSSGNTNDAFKESAVASPAAATVTKQIHYATSQGLQRQHQQLKPVRKMPINPLAFNRTHLSRRPSGPIQTRSYGAGGRRSASPNSTVQSSVVGFGESVVDGVNKVTGVNKGKERMRYDENAEDDDDNIPLTVFSNKQ